MARSASFWRPTLPVAACVVRAPSVWRSAVRSQGLGFDCVDQSAAEAVTQAREPRLGAGVEAQAGAVECGAVFAVEVFGGRQFQQCGRADPDGEARVTACDGVTDLIGFVLVEEEDLVRFRHCLRVAHSADEDAAIGEDEVCRGRAFLGAFVPACARAHDVP